MGNFGTGVGNGRGSGTTGAGVGNGQEQQPAAGTIDRPCPIEGIGESWAAGTLDGLSRSRRRGRRDGRLRETGVPNLPTCVSVTPAPALEPAPEPANVVTTPDDITILRIL